MITLDVNDPLVFDKWREAYSTLTDEEQNKFHNDLEARYPSQKHFILFNYDYIFSKIKDSRVFEVGGWKGELAQYCIEKYSIKSWTNMEFCQNAFLKGFKNEKYTVIRPEKFNWFDVSSKVNSKDKDIFVASHVIEHLSDEHLKKLLWFISDIKIILLEAPISETENNWSGYKGTHILKMGWNSIDKIMEIHKYNIKILNPQCRIYTKDVLK